MSLDWKYDVKKNIQLNFTRKVNDTLHEVITVIKPDKASDCSPEKAMEVFVKHGVVDIDISDVSDDLEEALAEYGYDSAEDYIAENGNDFHDIAVFIFNEGNSADYVRGGFFSSSYAEAYNSAIKDFGVTNNPLVWKSLSEFEDFADKNYIMTDENINYNGHLLHRIQAVAEICGSPETGSQDILPGTKGGWIESYNNLMNDREVVYCWIADEAKVYGRAVISDNARVENTAEVYDNAYVGENALIAGNAHVFGNAEIYDMIEITDNAAVYGNTVLNYDSLENGVVNGNTVILDGNVFSSKNAACLANKRSVRYNGFVR